MSGVRYSEAKKQKIVDLYVQEEMSVSAIARMRGMPAEKTVRMILKDRNVKLRGNRRIYDREAIRADMAKNPIGVVSKKYKCSLRFIYDLMKEDN